MQPRSPVTYDSKWGIALILGKIVERVALREAVEHREQEAAASVELDDAAKQRKASRRWWEAERGKGVGVSDGEYASNHLTLQSPRAAMNQPYGSTVTYLLDGHVEITLPDGARAAATLTDVITAHLVFYDPAGRTWYVGCAWATREIKIVEDVFARVEILHEGRWSPPPPIRKNGPVFADSHLFPSAPREFIAATEEMLLAEFSAQDEKWDGIAHEASRMVAEADARIAEKCREIGVPEELRPSLHVSWHCRGVNAYASRRAELRTGARTRIEAQLRRALADIEPRGVEVQTELVADGLTSGAALAFIASMPTAEALLPPLSVEDIRRALPNGENDYRDEASLLYALARGWPPRAMAEEADQ